MEAAQQLTDIINSLVSDPLNAITVSDTTGKFWEKDATADRLSQYYGGIPEFFNDIHSKGVTAIIVQPKRKNGNNYVTKGSPVYINMADKNTPPTGEPAAPYPQPQQQPVQQAQTYAPVGMGFPADPYGGIGLNGLGLLGGAMGEMAQKIHHYPTLLKENDELKRDKKDLEKEVKRLETELLENKFSDAKAEGNKAMLNGGMEALVQVLPLLMGNKGGALPVAEAAATGLAGAQLSPEHAELVQVVADLDGVYFPYAQGAIYGLLQNKEFGDEIINIMHKYQLIK